jgi:hypothetical protein
MRFCSTASWLGSALGDDEDCSCQYNAFGDARDDLPDESSARQQGASICITPGSTDWAWYDSLKCYNDYTQINNYNPNEKRTNQ